MKHKTPEDDWLNRQAGTESGACCLCEPPGPISGPIERPHHPDHLLASYRDEARWSAGIIAWSMDHPIAGVLPEADEE